MAINTINGDSGSATGAVITLTGGTSGAVFTGSSSSLITESFNYLALPSTTSTNGQITINGSRFMHANGTNNTFLGITAGNFTNPSTDMVGIGQSALGSAAGGGSTNNNFSIAIGTNALSALTSDSDNNIAIGGNAGASLTSTCANNVLIGQSAGTTSGTGFSNNIAIGGNALQGGTKSSSTNNVAIGTSVGSAITSGSTNIFLGLNSGAGVTTGSSNISINYPTSANVNNQLAIGSGTGAGSQQLSKSFIHGIRGTTTVNNDAIAVLIDSAGQLGTVSSSIRYKENVVDMGDVSSPLLSLRPVTFDFIGRPSHKKQVGLIAEEVEKTMPSLVAYNQEGTPESVKYHDLPVLLLNELQKAVKRLEVLEQKASSFFKE